MLGYNIPERLDQIIPRHMQHIIEIEYCLSVHLYPRLWLLLPFLWRVYPLRIHQLVVVDSGMDCYFLIPAIYQVIPLCIHSMDANFVLIAIVGRGSPIQFFRGFFCLAATEHDNGGSEQENDPHTG